MSGLADGLRAWYGADFGRVNAMLAAAPGDAIYDLQAQARAYRQVLSLLLAQRRPSHLLGPGRARLSALTDSYVRLAAEAGIIPARLRDAALDMKLEFRHSAPAPAAEVKSWKAAYAVRSRLLSLLGQASFYDTDRLDLSIGSTFDGALQQTITDVLERLHDPQHVKAAGLDQARMIGTGEPARVLYSFTLYERGAGFNFVRAQMDTGGAPFDVNEGARLELGSTAKLRTLATYRDVIATLHERYAALDSEVLSRVEVDRRDRLTRWAVDYLARAEDRSIDAMLEAALERRYSASPAERFFTAGGVHRFSNFSARNNGQTPTVREAFRGSINLPFIRLMRDIVRHYMFSGPDSAAALLDDPDHPRRPAYLARFADFEGREFLRRFYARHARLNAAEALEALAQDAKGIAVRLAVVFRSVQPRASLDAFAAFLNAHASRIPSERKIAELYETYAVDRFSLHDRGYLARIHPLELWLVAYLAEHADAGIDEVIAASAAERQAVYQWLYKRSKHAQDLRIRTLVEIDTFEKIHAHWARLGYPFDSLVASYATAIGVSGDNPAALAELMGIVLSGGAPLSDGAYRRAAFRRSDSLRHAVAA